MSSTLAAGDPAWRLGSVPPPGRRLGSSLLELWRPVRQRTAFQWPRSHGRLTGKLLRATKRKGSILLWSFWEQEKDPLSISKITFKCLFFSSFLSFFFPIKTIFFLAQQTGTEQFYMCTGTWVSCPFWPNLMIENWYIDRSHGANFNQMETELFHGGGKVICIWREKRGAHNYHRRFIHLTCIVTAILGPSWQSLKSLVSKDKWKPPLKMISF